MESVLLVPILFLQIEEISPESLAACLKSHSCGRARIQGFKQGYITPLHPEHTDTSTVTWLLRASRVWTSGLVVGPQLSRYGPSLPPGPEAAADSPADATGQ